MKKFTRRAALFGAGGAAGWTLSRSFGPNLPVYDGTRRIASGAGETTLNDASGLSPTPIHKHMIVKQDPDEALIAIVRQELAAARKDGRPLNVGAARHSMGVRPFPATARPSPLTMDRWNWTAPAAAIVPMPGHVGLR
ncbi:hypothetical protein ACFQFQ_24545 [Sulfitobacter porphyrae]|uniref:Uncharacterized protein n=1 Tax=Sulfitobacter porphyrae TaxID=1246864 RepID=A0ABW2B8N4_9RHOB